MVTVRKFEKWAIVNPNGWPHLSQSASTPEIAIRLFMESSHPIRENERKWETWKNYGFSVQRISIGPAEKTSDNETL
jgi:hypothetical protein